MAEKITVSSGPWPKGMDTRSPDYAVPADALRNAVDVDLLNDGRVRRRTGYSRVVSVVDPHSLWSCPLGTYFVAQGTLYRLNSDNTTTTILSGFIGRPVAFEYFNNDIYYSDGIINGKLLGGVTNFHWGISAPVTEPSLAPVGGSFAAGTHLGAASFVDTMGEESSISPLASLTTTVEGGIQFYNLPTPITTDIEYVRLYLSTTGGSTLYHVADVAPGTATYSVIAPTDTGKEADVTFYDKPPVCNIIRYKDGRMFCASGEVVWYTEPFALGRVRLAANYWQFTTAVTILEPVENGMYIVADKTYFYRFKDPTKAEVSELLSYGAVPYTSIKLPHGDGVMWQSERGAILASPQGEVKNVQEPYVTTSGAATGAAMLREKDGLRQFVAVLSEEAPNSLTATDFMEAEIIRRG